MDPPATSPVPPSWSQVQQPNFAGTWILATLVAIGFCVVGIIGFTAANATGNEPIVLLYVAMAIGGPFAALFVFVAAAGRAKGGRAQAEKQAQEEADRGQALENASLAQKVRASAAVIEQQGVAAERQGNLAGALAFYCQSLKSQPNPPLPEDEDRLRSRIIGVARQLRPQPELTEGAARAWGHARAALKTATNQSGMQASLPHFKALLLEAPWVADFYHNHAVALAYLERFDEAALNLKWYVLAAPNAPDAIAARRRMHEFEFRAQGSAPTVKA